MGGRYTPTTSDVFYALLRMKLIPNIHTTRYMTIEIEGGENPVVRVITTLNINWCKRVEEASEQWCEDNLEFEQLDHLDDLTLATRKQAQLSSFLFFNGIHYFDSCNTFSNEQQCYVNVLTLYLRPQPKSGGQWAEIDWIKDEIR